MPKLFLPRLKGASYYLHRMIANTVIILLLVWGGLTSTLANYLTLIALFKSHYPGNVVISQLSCLQTRGS